MDDFDEDVYMQEVEHERAAAALKKRWHIALPTYFREQIRHLHIKIEDDLPHEYVDSFLPPVLPPTPKSLWARLMALFKE